jgi:hypothetical protein
VYAYAINPNIKTTIIAYIVSRFIQTVIIIYMKIKNVQMSIQKIIGKKKIESNFILVFVVQRFPNTPSDTT